MDKVKDSNLKIISKKYNTLHKELSKIVAGQDLAVDKIIKGLYEAEMDSCAYEGRALARFFFFGPSGTGKTFLAEKIAECLKYPHSIFHMENYAYAGDEISLFGSDKQWKNARQGDLAKFIFENEETPHIVIFDEIEKAAQEVLNSMLYILSSSTIHDNYRNRDISLRNTIMIFTSNVGRDLFEDTSINFANIEIPTLIHALKNEKDYKGVNKFSSEFVSRIMANIVVTFNHLSVSTLNDIIKSEFNRFKHDMKENNSINVTIDDRIPLISIYHSGKADARIAKSLARNLIENEIFELGKMEEVIDLNKVKEIVYKVDFSNINSEIESLFVRKKKVKLGVIGNTEEFHRNSKDYEIVLIKNEEDLKKALKDDIFAYFVDPFYGGIKQKYLSITDYNSEGIKLLYKINENNNEVPIYVLIKNEKQISEADKTSLIRDGVREVLFVKGKASFKRKILKIIESNYLESQINLLNQKGWIVDFKTKQNVSNNGTKIIITLCDFKKYMAYDSNSRNLMLKTADIPDTKFDEVIGCEEAKEELKYYIKYLKNPIEFVVSGNRQPKGVLLFGPPGTGKTMLARAMAGEAGVNFISVTAADFILSNAEERLDIKRLFASARKYAPTIVFIDEIDAIGKKRNGSSIDSILTSLLTEMDGFNKSNKRPVFVLAATNYGTNNRNKDIAQLDNALLRRFDSNVYVNLPNKDNRIEYINFYLINHSIKGIKKDTIESLANCTVGLSLATLENILELASRNAIRNEKNVDDNELINALDQYQNGKIKKQNLEEMKSLAIHEAGHATVSFLCGNVPSYITIESRGNYGGYVMNADDEKICWTKKELLNKIKTNLAGKAAQEVFLGKDEAQNTGASSDLKNSTDIALNIVSNFGMDESLLTFDRESIFTSPNSKQYIEQAEEILNEQYKETLKLIEDNKNKVQGIVNELIIEGHLTKGEIEKLLKTKKR